MMLNYMLICEKSVWEMALGEKSAAESYTLVCASFEEISWLSGTTDGPEARDSN